MRPFQVSWRVRECGRLAAWGEDHIQVREGEVGWSFGHLHRCGNVWACPVCSHQIASQRGAELTRAIEWWRAGDDNATSDVVLMTLTVRHHAGEDLGALRKAVAKAWRALQQTRGWRAMREACGIMHTVRCQEVTHGDNGWHPHVHVLLFCRLPELAMTWHAQMTDWWRHQVALSMGADHLPSRRRAVSIDACHDGSYLARIGLEVGSPAAKHARDGHLTAMQLATQLVASTGPERERLAGLWREYVTAMQGAHQLQWSRGLKEALGVAESDGSIVDTDKDRPQRIVIAEIPKETWRATTLRSGVAQLDALGKSQHGLGIFKAQDALLAFFQSGEDARCRWVMRGGRKRLRWDTDSDAILPSPG